MNTTDEKGLSSVMPQGAEATSVAQLGASLSKLAKELMDSGTAPIIDAYSQGKNFTIGDNTKLYEIVKVVQDVVNNQFYNKGTKSFNFQFSIDVKQHMIVFSITFDDQQAASDMENKIVNPATIETTMDFAEKLADLITFQIQRKYADSIEIERKIEPIMSTDVFMSNVGKTQLQLLVKEKVDEDKSE